MSRIIDALRRKGPSGEPKNRGPLQELLERQRALDARLAAIDAANGVDRERQRRIGAGEDVENIPPPEPPEQVRIAPRQLEIPAGLLNSLNEARSNFFTLEPETEPEVAERWRQEYASVKQEIVKHFLLDGCI